MTVHECIEQYADCLWTLLEEFKLRSAVISKDLAASLASTLERVFRANRDDEVLEFSLIAANLATRHAIFSRVLWQPTLVTVERHFALTAIYLLGGKVAPK